MELRDKVVVVTGGAGGIGSALCRRFHAEGARGIAVVDLDEAATQAVADEVDGLAIAGDISIEATHVGIVEQTEDRWGPIDLYCSNAGVAIGGSPLTATLDDWQRSWDVNLMAHVWAAKAVLPSMVARGEGYLLNTASAAGLLTNLGAAPYTVTKHGAVGLAEWLSITYGDAGIKVSCLCPQGVRTKMLFPDGPDEAGGDVVRAQGVIEPDELAEAVVQGLAAETFLILPHPEVLGYIQFKTGDYDKWLKSMRKLQARFIGDTGS